MVALRMPNSPELKRPARKSLDALHMPRAAHLRRQTARVRSKGENGSLGAREDRGIALFCAREIALQFHISCSPASGGGANGGVSGSGSNFNLRGIWPGIALRRNCCIVRQTAPCHGSAWRAAQSLRSFRCSRACICAATAAKAAEALAAIEGMAVPEGKATTPSCDAMRSFWKARVGGERGRLLLEKQVSVTKRQRKG